LGVGGGSKGVVFTLNRKTVKNLIKCLIFNDLLFYGILYGGFTVALRFCANFVKTYDNKPKQCVKSLTFNALRTSSKCLIFNGFAVLGGSRVGC
jgi:hypothetical protein